jgi:hypothetical protein
MSMDLVTLITACALGVEPNGPRSSLDPKVMQALIFEQSGGEPWSFSLQGEGFARVLPTMHDAFREARAVRPDRQKIHIGLAGLPTDPASATALMFAPCPNIALATVEIAQFVERCKTTSKPDPIYCAIAVYHGSWERPDEWFANDVRATVTKGNAPNFEMPNDGYLDAGDVAAHATPADRDAVPTGSLSSPDDRRRAWSSALFPATPKTADRQLTDIQNRDYDAAQSHSIGASTDVTLTNKTQSHDLFVPGSGEPKR